MVARGVTAGGPQDAEPPSLDRRPTATQWAVEDLLRFVREGRIRIPTFQRSWQWRAKDVRELFDSIYRGYPVGTLLLWKRREVAGTVKIGPHLFPVATRDDALSVIDGQQRLTALAGVLIAHPLSDPPDEFDLYFDLDSERFVYPTRTKAPQPGWIPMSVVVDAEHLFSWLDEHRRSDPPKEHVQRAIRLGKLMREYQIPAYVVEADDEDGPRQVFKRINSAGQRLKEWDIFDALRGGRAGSVPSSTREIQRTLGGLGFGEVPRRTILRAVQAIERGEISQAEDEPRAEGAHSGEVLGRAERALHRTITFLLEEARIPHIRLLPYEMPIVVLSKLFDRHPDLSVRSKQLLRRWVWRGAIAEAHRGDIVGLRAALDALEGAKETAAVSALLGQLPPKPPAPPTLETFNFRFARSKLEVLVLASLAPRSFTSGEIVQVQDVLEEGRPLSLPHFVGRERSLRLEGLASTVANRAFHPRFASSDLRRDVPADVLESHGIEREAWEALIAGDGERFLTRRAARIVKARDDLFEARAEWSHTDRPSLRSLTVPDED